MKTHIVPAFAGAAIAFIFLALRDGGIGNVNLPSFILACTISIPIGTVLGSWLDKMLARKSEPERIERVQLEQGAEDTRLTMHLYAALPLDGVAIDYDGELRMQGDMVHIMRWFGGARFRCDLLVDQKIFIAGQYSHETAAKILANTLLERHPQPWAAFAAKCSILNSEDIVGGGIMQCIYGIKPVVK